MLDRLRRLQQLRDAAESLVVQQKTKRFDADLAIADVLMPVDARAERLLRVVEVEGADVVDADVLIERINRSLVIVAIAQLITRGEHVAGIEAGIQVPEYCRALAVFRQAQESSQAAVALRMSKEVDEPASIFQHRAGLRLQVKVKELYAEWESASAAVDGLN